MEEVFSNYLYQKEEGKILRCLSFKLLNCPKLYFDYHNNNHWDTISLCPDQIIICSREQLIWQQAKVEKVFLCLGRVINFEIYLKRDGEYFSTFSLILSLHLITPQKYLTYL